MGIAIFLIIAAVYLAFAGQLGRRSVTMPMVFLTLGLIIGLSPWQLLEGGTQSEALRLLAELTLAMILFADASMLNLRAIWADRELPARLLLIGLPLCLVLGALVARLLFPEAPLGMALLIAAILVPTDAALGLPVFTDERIPTRIRNALNVESGLNDGIVTPFVGLFLALTLAEENVLLGNWLVDSAVELTVGVGVGVALGWLGGRLLETARRNRWASGQSERLAILALGLGCYFLAGALGGNGFVAAFVGGIIFGAASRRDLAEEAEFTEDVGTLLSLAVWTQFGVLVASGSLINDILAAGWTPLLYALLSLTVIRMVSVAISLIGTGLRSETVALMGWFGPRGLASVVFGLLALLTFEEAGQPIEPLVATVTWTVTLSVFAHGLTAQPLVSRYAARLSGAEVGHREMEEATELPLRRGTLAPMTQK
jgi:NhaP-type Na+/H+ or K+/H+ antiporter